MSLYIYIYGFSVAFSFEFLRWVHKLHLIIIDKQTDHLISARRPDLIIIKKIRELAKLWSLLSRLTREKNWKKIKRSINIWTLQGNWKAVEHKSENHTNCDWCSWYSHRRIIKGTRGLGNKRTRRDRPNYCIIEID